MKSVFSFGLYREGLKKVKLVGIVAAILCVVITALIPIVNMINCSQREANFPGSINVETVEIGSLAIPLLLILVFTPVFIYMMFSFLNKRSESDFYHSIPYRRECVCISFTSAALTWIWGIIIVTLTVAGILWGVNPYTAFAVSDFFRLGLAYILSTAFIAGLMLVAMTLTGTVATNLSIFALLACFVRVLGALIVHCLEELVPVYLISYSPAAFLKADFSLPIGLFRAATLPGEGIRVFTNIPLFIYTGVCAVLLIAAGCLLYRFRKSEMAGMSAPNRVFQHIFRCAVTLPFVLLFATEILTGAEVPQILVTGVGILAVYYLYELITTKRVKRLLSATPFLGVLAVAGGIFVGSILLVSNGILNENIPAEKIDGIGNYAAGSSYGNADYQSVSTAGITIRDERAAQIVADALWDSEKAAKKGTYYNYRSDYDGKAVLYVYRSVEIRLKSGKVIGRKIRIPSERNTELDQCFLNSPEYSKAVLTLPEEKEITYLYLSNNLNDVSISSQSIQKLWNIFRSEYETMSDEEKYSVLYEREDIGVTLYINGQRNFLYYSLPIPITNKTPKTMNFFVQEISQTSRHLSDAKQLLENMADDDWWKTTKVLEVELRFDMFGSSSSLPDVYGSMVRAWNYHNAGDDHSGVAGIAEYLSKITDQDLSDEAPCIILTVSTTYDDNRFVSDGGIDYDSVNWTTDTYFARLTVSQYQTLVERLESYHNTEHK